MGVFLIIINYWLDFKKKKYFILRCVGGKILSLQHRTFTGRVKVLKVACVWAGFCGVRSQCDTSCFVGKIREQS